MRNLIAFVALCSAAAAQPATPSRTPGQTAKPPAAAEPKKPSTGPESPGRGPAASVAAKPPSVKDLKFPPLHPIQIPKVETVTLPNGMKVFLLEDHELPTVHGLALVRTGNLFDPADKVGLATLTGMVMRTGGTKAKTGEQLDQQLENVAASVETEIGETSGSVGFSALKENTDEVLAVFKDVITAPEFRPDKIDLAKTQIRSSIARRNDDADGLLQREFADIVYGRDNPYGWRMEYTTIERITRADLQNFYQRYFFPGNVLFGMWGDFDSTAMKDKIGKLFADWTVKQPPVPDFPKVAGKPAPGTFLANKKDVTQTFFAVGQLGGVLKDKDYPALDIMSNILGGGFQSRLFQRVRTKMGNAYDISASWGANYDHPGLFEISGSTKSLSTVETLKAAVEEAERIRTGEVTEDELKSAKESALNSLVFAFDTKSKTLRRLLIYEYFHYPVDFIQQYQKAIEGVTRADVLRVAKEHLDPASFTIVAVGNPQDFGQPLEALGNPVSPIDLTIAQPKLEAAKADEAGIARGKQLLARAQQAAGGADKLAAVKDYTQTAEFHLANGLNVKEVDRWMSPNYFRQETNVPAGRLAAFYDGKTGHISTPQGAGLLAGPQLKQVQGDLFRVPFRMLLSDRDPGRVVNAIDDNTVEISDSNTGDIVQVAFDPQTGLVSHVRYQTITVSGPPIPVEETWSDFRDIAGVKIPHKITILQGGQKFADVMVTEYTINSGLKLPDLEKLR